MIKGKNFRSAEKRQKVFNSYQFFFKFSLLKLFFPRKFVILLYRLTTIALISNIFSSFNWISWKNKNIKKLIWMKKDQKITVDNLKIPFISWFEIDYVHASCKLIILNILMQNSPQFQPIYYLFWDPLKQAELLQSIDQSAIT